MSFAKTLNKVSDKYHTSKLFDDFLQMSVCAFSLGRSENIYNDIAKKYNKEEIKAFGDTLGTLILEHERQNKNGWKDFLGNYFEEFGQYNTKLGQFFTPVSLCNLMSNLINDNRTSDYRMTVNDPTCGSSRNLIAHSMKDPNNRFNYFYIGQDLDRRCCLMSVLNFVMFGMSGVIIHMNALSNEIYEGWRIWMPETCLGVQPLNVNECKKFLYDKKIIEEKPTQQQPIQLSLF